MPRFLILLAALLLSGCVTYSGGGGYADKVGNYLNYSTKSGRMAVVVVGDPVPGGAGKIESMIVRALDANFATLKSDFVPTPVTVPAPDKFLFAFDPEFTTFSSEICRNPAAVKTDHQGPRMRIGAIYCSDRAISQVWARLDRVRSADDPVLAEVIDGLASRLVPTRQRQIY